MGCAVLPHIPIPTLPFPFTIGLPTTPPVNFDLNLCCKILSIHIPPLPIIPGLSELIVATPGLVSTIQNAIQAINAYIDLLPLACPLE